MVTVNIFVLVLWGLICWLGLGESFGQYYSGQNKTWVFGTDSGVGFSSGAPVPFTTPINQGEGSASVSDASGNLLFYTDGKTIFDRNGNIMPNGASVTPYITWSASQAAAVAPVIGNHDRYYVFSCEQGPIVTGTTASHIVYCLVDLTLNNGLGDVVPGTLATPLISKASEKMLIVPGDSCDLWLVTHNFDTSFQLAPYAPTFNSFHITAAGINPAPVSSITGWWQNYSIGMLKASPDRRLLICQSYIDFGGSELYDFDPATGVVSNVRKFNQYNHVYGAEFSPDNTKLYSSYQITATTDFEIAQYNVTLSSGAAIDASKSVIAFAPTFNGQVTDLKLACDGKIYCRDLGNTGTYLDRIDNPNAAGSSCNYTPNVVVINHIEIGLPNTFFNIIPKDTVYTVHDTALCIPQGDSIALSARRGNDYLWYDGLTAQTHYVHGIGTYWVATADFCVYYIDTFRLLPLAFDSSVIRRDTAFCFNGASVSLVGPAGFDTYQWNTGSHSPSIQIVDTGIYWVVSLNSCHQLTDTIAVHPGTDTIYKTETLSLCKGSKLVLTADSSAEYAWSTQDTTRAIVVTQPGIYSVTGTTNNGCIIRAIDTFIVLYRPEDTVLLELHKSKCAGMHIPLTAQEADAYLWSTSDTTQQITVSGPGTYTVTEKHSDTCTSYFVRNFYVSDTACPGLDCRIRFPDAFTPNGDGKNDVFRPNGYIPLRQYKLEIYSRWGEKLYQTYNPEDGWNGTYKGYLMPVGTYYYICYLSCSGTGSLIRKGDLTLVR